MFGLNFEWPWDKARRLRAEEERRREDEFVRQQIEAMRVREANRVRLRLMRGGRVG